jgi:hypothetical protein
MTVPTQADMPVPTYRIGFAAQPLDVLSGITWTDVTSFTWATDGLERLRVLTRNTTAGTQHELSKVESSAGRYLLDNRDGAFNPMNASSPYYPNVKTGVIFQELQTWASITYAVYTGFIEDFDLRWDEFGLSQVFITCADAYKWLNLDKLDESAWRIEVRKDVSANVAAGRNTAWLRLNDSNSSLVATDYSGMGFDGTYQNGPVLGQPSLIVGETDTCMDAAREADQRASLPYKHLITQFPFTIECVFRLAEDRVHQRGLVLAFEGPSTPINQNIEFYVDSDFGSQPGKIYALIQSSATAFRSASSSVTVDDFVTHHLAVVYSSASVILIYIDAVDRTVAGTGPGAAIPTDLATGFAIGNTPANTFGDFGIDAGFALDADGNDVLGGIQSVVFYDGLALSPTRIAAHATASRTGWGAESAGARINHILDAIGWATADRDIDTGSASVIAGVPGGTGLGHIELVTETEGGRFYVAPNGKPTFRGRTYPILNTRARTSQASFSDDGTTGTIPYVPPFDPHLDDLDTWTRASVARINGSPQLYDTTPGSNAVRTLAKSGLLMADDRDARAMAQYLANLHKTSRVRVRTLAFLPQKSALGWAAALGLQQWDRITVKRSPGGGGAAWTSDWLIEGIEHDCQGAGEFWTTRLALSPADPSTYFIVGSSLIGGADVLFY